MIDPKYGSHLPILLRLVDLTAGPILELGTGGYSTAMLDLMCRQTKRKLVSYDNDPKWHKDNLQWQSDFHDIKLIQDWDKAEIDSIHWSIVLIDHRPALRRRVEAVRLKDKADFILLHDSEPEIDRFYRYSSIYKHFKSRYDYTKVKPNTTILSNFVDIKKLLDN